MKFLISVDEGFEDTAVSEIAQKTPATLVAKRQCLCVDIEPLTALQIAYTAHSINRVIALFDCFTFTDKEELAQKLDSVCSTIAFEDWLPKQEFNVWCERSGTHTFNTGDLFSMFVPLLKEKSKCAFNKKSSYILCCKIVDSHCYVGMDIAGKDLSKRDYRLFIHPSDINAGFAYHLLHTAGYTGKEKLLLAYCSSGTLPIEATLKSMHRAPSQQDSATFTFHTLPVFSHYSTEKLITQQPSTQLPIFGFDKNPLINFAKKNARIAQVASSLHFTEQFPEEKFDIVVARLAPPKFNNQSALQRYIDSFLKQSKQALLSQGTLLCFSNKIHALQDRVEQHGFVLTKQEDIFRGNMQYTLFLLSRK